MFEGEGRLQSAHEGATVFKRGYDHGVIARERAAARRFAPGWRPLPAGEVAALVRRVGERLARLEAALPADAPPAVRARLARLRTWDEAAYAADAARFREVYTPVSILPPDQYMALVLQATLGCHHNRCTFCRLYADTPFRIKAPAEFGAHIEDVLRFTGASAGQRRSLFIADANALVHAQHKLRPLLAEVHRRFEVAPPDLPPERRAAWLEADARRVSGLYSFIDAFTGIRKTVADFEELAALGLRRVYIGVETGHDPLLGFVEKPASAAAVAALSEALHAAGVGVGYILMVGLGGEAFAEAHVADTLALMQAAQPRPGDVIYLSPFVDVPGGAYAERARAAGIRPLGEAALEAQYARLRAGLGGFPGVKAAPYHIELFRYG